MVSLELRTTIFVPNMLKYTISVSASRGVWPEVDCKARESYARHVLATCENPSHIGMSRGISSMFPINGRPLGPGGYGSLDPLPESRDLRYPTSAASERVAPKGMTKWESTFDSLSMGRGANEKIQ